MKIYVASSWRNEYQPRCVTLLKDLGHDVYDFRNPAPGNTGFQWSAIDPNWIFWSPEKYIKALSHPVAEEGYRLDYEAMAASDCCLLVLPSGRSAHIEAGWLKGNGKLLYVFQPEPMEPELMYKLADGILIDFDELKVQFTQINI